MLTFMQNWLAPAPHPIGISIGQRWIRMAQVECVGGEFRLLAASGIEVSAVARHDPAQRLALFAQSAREMLVRGNFRGDRVVFAASASDLFVHQLRLPRMDAALVEKAIRWESRGKLPTDPVHAIVRHFIAGEVQHEGRPCLDVIALSMNRPAVTSLLGAARNAGLDVLGIHAEPSAMVDCFANIYRRKTDATMVNAFIDIGCSTTRIIIAQGRKILHIRTIPLASDDFNRAVAEALQLSVEDAAELRGKLALGELKDDSRSFPAEAVVEPSQVPQQADAAKRRDVDRAIETDQSRLAQALSLCCRQHAWAFSQLPVQRLIFVGGEASNRALCQSLAKEIGIAAQIGDPLVRMGRTTPVGIAGGIDRRLPQPSWAVAIGLSMGGSIYSRGGAPSCAPESRRDRPDGRQSSAPPAPLPAEPCESDKNSR